MHVGERKLYEYIKTILPKSTIVYNAKFKWGKNITYLPYDFLIVDKRTIVELDGPQHYGEMKIWDCERTMRHDKIKDNAALENNYRLIRLRYTSMDRVECLQRLKCVLECPFKVEIVRIE
jgi:very-short-patch-repair endonuclease